MRGQYAEGAINGEPVVGYRQEKNVNRIRKPKRSSRCGFYIDNWRWAEVPIYMRVGKRLPKSGYGDFRPFQKSAGGSFQQRFASIKTCCVIRIQPDEGISLRIHAKVPGTSFRIEPVKMDFHYGTSFGKASPEAYERLLLDAMSGDATLFARRDEVEEAWAFIDPIEEAWHAKKDAPEFVFLSRRLVGTGGSR